MKTIPQMLAEAELVLNPRPSILGQVIINLAFLLTCGAGILAAAISVMLYIAAGYI